MIIVFSSAPTLEGLLFSSFSLTYDFKVGGVIIVKNKQKPFIFLLFMTEMNVFCFLLLFLAWGIFINVSFH